MPSRIVTTLIAATGLALVGAGATFAYVDTPAATVITADPPEQAGTSGSGVEAARRNLQQAGMPLAFLGGGVAQLTDGSNQLDDGSHQLADGLRQARDGGRQLADGLGQLDDGVGLLGDGAHQVSAGVEEVVARLTDLGGIQGDVTAQLTTVADALAAAPDPVSRNAAGQLRALVDLLNTQGIGPGTLDQLTQLRDGARQLAYELTAPDARFVAGMAQAADGARLLHDGLVLLDDGGKALTEGTGQLVDGVAPVAGVVEGISQNVRTATEALPRTTVAQADPAVVMGSRHWWPYAAIAAGAAALFAAAARRPAPSSARRR